MQCCTLAHQENENTAQVNPIEITIQLLMRRFNCVQLKIQLSQLWTIFERVQHDFPGILLFHLHLTLYCNKNSGMKQWSQQMNSLASENCSFPLLFSHCDSIIHSFDSRKRTTEEHRWKAISSYLFSWPPERYCSHCDSNRLFFLPSLSVEVGKLCTRWDDSVSLFLAFFMLRGPLKSLFTCRSVLLWRFVQFHSYSCRWWKDLCSNREWWLWRVKRGRFSLHGKFPF